MGLPLLLFIVKDMSELLVWANMLRTVSGTAFYRHPWTLLQQRAPKQSRRPVLHSGPGCRLRWGSLTRVTIRWKFLLKDPWLTAVVIIVPRLRIKQTPRLGVQAPPGLNPLQLVLSSSPLSVVVVLCLAPVVPRKVPQFLVKVVVPLPMLVSPLVVHLGPQSSRLVVRPVASPLSTPSTLL